MSVPARHGQQPEQPPAQWRSLQHSGEEAHTPLLRVAAGCGLVRHTALVPALDDAHTFGEAFDTSHPWRQDVVIGELLAVQRLDELTSQCSVSHSARRCVNWCVEPFR